MEKTLGKRIMTHRKRLGLTQDQLAEKLGVTAQAVSKWENDQSCPDINMLPVLAEIFGISTDELLGREQEMIHEAEVVDHEESQENDGIHIQKGNWEFKYDNSKMSALGFAVWVLLSGGLLLLSSILEWRADLWDVLWPSALLVFGLFGLFPKFSFFRLGCTFFGGYFLMNNLGFMPFDFDTELLIAVILVLLGISLLVDALRKPKKPKFEFTYNGDRHGSRVPKHNFDISGETFNYSASFGDEQQYVSMPRLSHGEINTSFGDYDIDLSGVVQIAENCTLTANSSFGDLTILVPRRYAVRGTNSASFASIEYEGKPDPEPVGVIRMEANASFGQITVTYI